MSEDIKIQLVPRQGREGRGGKGGRKERGGREGGKKGREGREGRKKGGRGKVSVKCKLHVMSGSYEGIKDSEKISINTATSTM